MLFASGWPWRRGIPSEVAKSRLRLLRLRVLRSPLQSQPRFLKTYSPVSARQFFEKNTKGFGTARSQSTSSPVAPHITAAILTKTTVPSTLNRLSKRTQRFSNRIKHTPFPSVHTISEPRRGPMLVNAVVGWLAVVTASLIVAGGKPSTLGGVRRNIPRTKISRFFIPRRA